MEGILAKKFIKWPDAMTTLKARRILMADSSRWACPYKASPMKTGMTIDLSMNMMPDFMHLALSRWAIKVALTLADLKNIICIMVLICSPNSTRVLMHSSV